MKSSASLRLQAWVAILALVLAALLPSLTRVGSAAGALPAYLQELCSVNTAPGLGKAVSLASSLSASKSDTAKGEKPASSHAAQGHGDCALCLSHALALPVPPVVNLAVAALPWSATQVAVVQAAQRLRTVWVPGSARAPPAWF